MPQGSSYHDLHRIFRYSITVREIAVPLFSFEADHSAPKVRQLMEDRDFDVVGVRVNGVITGYIRRKELGGGEVAEYRQDFAENDLIEESDSLLLTLERLRENDWVFVRFLGNPSGIVTRGDLQKTPMRLWIFGLISLLEMQLTQKIKEACPKEEWKEVLSKDRLDKAKIIFDLQNAQNEAIDLVECLQLCDKRTIFKRHRDLLAATPFEAPSHWDNFMKRAEKLRNLLAHSGNIPSGQWQDNALLVGEIENTLRKLETV